MLQQSAPQNLKDLHEEKAEMVMTDEIQYKYDTLRKIGDNFRNERDTWIIKGIRLSQKQIAEMLGVTNIYLSQIENGFKMPSLFFLIRARALFGLDLNVLLEPAVSRYRAEMSSDMEWYMNLLPESEVSYRQKRRCGNEYTH